VAPQPAPVTDITDADVTAAGEAVHRFLSARLRDRHLVEDVCQEAIARLLQARDRLDSSSATPYAITVAKSILIGDARKADVAKRHIHRLDRGTPPPSPEDLAVLRAEASAVNVALHALPDEDRQDLVAHVVEGEPTSALAARSSGTPGAIAARLARTRSRMRVEYLVAARGLTLPTERCHPVLVALSAGDRRRQRALNAAEHLVDCGTCADLAPPLVERQRSLVALVPIPAVAPFLGRLRRAKRSTQVMAISAVVATALVAAVIVATNAHAPARHTATSSSTTTTSRVASTRLAAPPSVQISIDGKPAAALLQTRRALALVGKPVEVRRLRVLSVPADEGFWIDAGSSRRVWVQLLTAQGESPVRIRPGMFVSFRGTLRAHGPAFPAAVGLTPSAGARELAARSLHIETDATAVRLPAG